MTEPWERLPNEPMRWHARFQRFLAMGAEARSVLGAVHVEEAEKGKERQSPRPSGAWVRASRRWLWKQRSEAWDAQQLELRRSEEEQARRREREARLNTLRAARQILTREIADLVQDPDRAKQMSPAQVIACLQIVFREQRIEYGEPTTNTRSEQTGPGGGPVRTHVGVDVEAVLASLDLEGVRLWRQLVDRLRLTQGAEGVDRGGV